MVIAHCQEMNDVYTITAGVVTAVVILGILFLIGYWMHKEL